MNRSIWLIIAGLALIVLVLTVYGLRPKAQKTFPSLRAGEYLGILQGALSLSAGEDERTNLFYIANPVGQQDYHVAVFAPNFLAQRVQIHKLDEKLNANGNTLPLNLLTEKSQFVLSGKELSTGSFRGIFQEPQLKLEGTWEMSYSNPRPLKVKDEVMLYLSLNNELSKVNQMLVEKQDEVSRQKEQIEKLSASITEGQGLKGRADQRYNKAIAEIKTRNEILTRRKQDLKVLEQRLAVAQRVTVAGKLVSLAREALERDSRWFDAMLKGATVEEPAGLSDMVARGEKVLGLKRQIAQEQEKIRSLTQVVVPEPQEVEAKGRFW